MDSGQTLHDFVLNLLGDPHARAAFELDPQGALHSAGLSDITAADVQDVIPLVIDYAPVQGLTDLTSSLDGTGLGSLDATPAGAIHQLQLVTQQISPVNQITNDLNLAAAGAITTGQQGLTSWLGVTSNGGEIAATAGGAADLPHVFTANGDLSVTLDSHALDGGLANPVGTADGLVSTVDGVAHPVTGQLTDGLNLGGLNVGGLDLGGLTGGDLHGVTGTVDGLTGTVGGLTGTLGGATGTLGGLTDTLHGLTGGLTGSADVSPTHANPLSVDSSAVDTVHSSVSQVGNTVHSTGVGGVLGHDSHLLDTSHLPAGDLLGGVTDHLL
jgi:hypothetical protein